MTERQSKYICVFDQEQYDGDWPPTNLVAAIDWFRAKLNEIPPEFRDTARLEIDSVSSYEGSSYGHIAISYYRPETGEEMAERLQRHHNRLRAQEADERRAYERLKAKFER